MILRSWLFTILFALSTVVISLIFFPFLIFRVRALYWTGYVWSKTSLFLLKLICGIDYEVEGRNHIPKGPYIIASKHQSVFETIVFWSVFYIPTFVLKKELLSLPFFGIYLRRMKMISIDRKDGRNALKKIIAESEYHIKHKRHIIIFPEGTRTSYGTKKEKYSPGIAALYQGINVPVLPVGINSGKYWPSKGGGKKSGTITIKLLKPIGAGMDRKKFMAKLYDEIEGASEKL